MSLPALAKSVREDTLDFARRSIFSVGSDPTDKRHVKGVPQPLSFHIASISRINPSAYFPPRDSAM